MIFLLPILLLTLLPLPSSLSASTPSTPSHSTIEALSRLNRQSPIEGAGSHGSIGFSLGVGVRQEHLPGPSSDSSPTSDTAATSTNTNLLETQLIKGFSWPVDLGITFSKPVDSVLQRFGGYVQWTIYEALALPAIAVRLGQSRLFGFNGQATTTCGQAVVSYGFLRYFTVYGGVSGDYVQAAINGPADDPGLLSLYSQDAEPTNHSWYENGRFYGTRILILPAMGAIALEASERSDEPTAYAAKISFGM